MGVTADAARSTLTTLIQAGIDLQSTSSDGIGTAAKLARASQDLAVVTGQNSSETLQRLIINVQQLDSMGLRHMGIMVDREVAEQKFASALGKTSAELTQQQRTQAFLNETLAQAGKLSGAYEESMETVGKKMGSLSRYQQELAISVGDKLLPAYGAIVDGATSFLKNLTEQVKAFDKNGEMAAKLGAIVTTLVQKFEKFGLVVVSAFMESGNEILGVIGAVGSLIGMYMDAATAIWGMVKGSIIS